MRIAVIGPAKVVFSYGKISGFRRTDHSDSHRRQTTTTQLQRAPKDGSPHVMTTKSSPHATEHITRYQPRRTSFRATQIPRNRSRVEAWKLYRAHLDKGLTTAPDWWVPQQLRTPQRTPLQTRPSHYTFTQQIRVSKQALHTTQQRRQKADQETLLTRTPWLEVLQHKRALPLQTN